MIRREYKAVCPLQVGDTVIEKISDNFIPRRVFYVPPGATIHEASVKLHKVTDIASTYYFNSNKTQFTYELDGNGKYQPLEVIVPIQELDAILKVRDLKKQ